MLLIAYISPPPLARRAPGVSRTPPQPNRRALCVLQRGRTPSKRQEARKLAFLVVMYQAWKKSSQPLPLEFIVEFYGC